MNLRIFENWNNLKTIRRKTSYKKSCVISIVISSRLFLYFRFILFLYIFFLISSDGRFEESVNIFNVTLAIHGVELFPVRGLASPGGTAGSPGRTLSPDVVTDESRSSLSSASPRTGSPNHNMLDFTTNTNPSTLPSPSMLSFLNLNMESAARNSSSGLVLGSPPLAALHSMTEMKTQALLHSQVSYLYFYFSWSTL